MSPLTALFYCSHPDIHPAIPSGYATHINGVLSGLALNGVSTRTCLAGNAREPTTERADELAKGRLRSCVRQAAPTLGWNAARDLRLLSYDPRSAMKLDQLLRVRPPAIVYERHTHLHHLGHRVARKRGVTHVLEVNAPPSERSDLGGASVFDRLAISCSRSAVLNTNVCVFVSSALKSTYQELCNDPLDHCIVVPNGIDADLAGPGSVVTSDAEDGRLVIGFTGSLFGWHGLDILIRAFASLPLGSNDAQLVIVGDGPALSSLRELATELGLKGRVQFAGAVSHEDALSWTRRFDIAVMADSNWYGSPTKLAEYAAAGCAIIAPSTAPVAEVFTHEVNALIAQPTVGDLAQCLRRLAAQPDFRARLGQDARCLALESLTWETLVRGILQKVEEVTS